MKPGRLTITRGLPGCGKTTRALLWVAENPQRRCRVNRDDLRVMLHATRFSGDRVLERAVTEVQHASIHALLVAGFDVVSDDTWLIDDHVEAIRILAESAGAGMEVWDMRDMLLDICVQRDAARSAPVGADVIVRLHRRYIHTS